MTQTQKNEIHLAADIIVVGGGHSGLTQTLLLGLNGFKVICIDREEPQNILNPDHDGRTTAISYGSHQLMKAADLWDALLPHACAIQDIQILDGNSPVLLDFPGTEIDNKKETAFGWIIENYILHKILHEEIAKYKNITHLCRKKAQDFKLEKNFVTVLLDDGKSLSASLVIGADGRQSFTREWMNVGTRKWSYNQQALVTIVTHEMPHNNNAVEHFKPEGPFAILPMPDDENGKHRSSIVWTQHGEHNQRVLNYDDTTFLIALNSLFPDSYGEIIKAGKRFTYPLNFVHAYNYIAPRMVLIADAAHGIHPIAGQGLNLGLRDVAALTEILMDARKQNKDIGSIEILKKYQRARRIDNMAMAVTTDLLNKLFSNNIPPVKIARKIGLKIVGRLSPVKKFFMRQAMGTSGHLPKTIREGKL